MNNMDNMDNMDNKYNFPEDYTQGEKIRDQVIYDILFAQDPPSIEEIFEYIPKQLICQINDSNIENYRLWNAWVVGSLNIICKFRNNQNNNQNKNDGWGKQNTMQRSIIENQMYNIIKNQQEQINELKNKN